MKTDMTMSPYSRAARRHEQVNVMGNRRGIPPKVVADVVTASRRRCCVCLALRRDEEEKIGQIAHLDHDPSNNALKNLAFLCLEHHDQYDSRTSQSKGLTIEEVKRYRDELFALVARSIPPSDSEIVAALVASLDRPAYRTTFHQESSLPRFREAIAETIETLNTGCTHRDYSFHPSFKSETQRCAPKLNNSSRHLLRSVPASTDYFA
jgi:hypothetical protein